MAIQGRYIMRKGKKWLAAAVSVAMLIQPMAGIGSVYAADGVDIASTFTDSTFRKYVSENFDTDGNGYLSDDEIAAVKTVDVSKCAPAIISLEGVQMFTGLTELNCSGQGIRNLNIQNLTALEQIDVSNNMISSLTLPVEADNLVYLDVSNNHITSLTSLSEYDNLTFLNANVTNLSEISVANMKNLAYLGVNATTISKLDLSANTNLRILECRAMTAMSELDVSNHPELVTLLCDSASDKLKSSLTKLNVSGDTSLVKVDCSMSNISDLDISNTPALETLNCSNSKLDNIDVSANKSLKELNVSNNTLGKLDISSNINLEILSASEIGITDIDVSNQRSLTTLDLSGNKLVGIDVSKNESLDNLDLNDNNLEQIDVSKNVKLTSLTLDNNSLVCIDISKNTYLYDGKHKSTFSCYGNTRDITLEKPNFDFDLTQYSIDYGFHKWWDDSEFPIIKDEDTGYTKIGRQDDTVGYAGIAAGVTSDKTKYTVNGANIDGYHLNAKPNASAVEYDYFYGYGKNTVSFTLNITNPLTVVVWYSTDKGVVKSGESTLKFKVGDSTTFTAKDKKGNLHESVTWSSTNENVVKVDASTGKAECVGAGDAEVYVNLNGRAIGYVKVNCHNPVDEMSLVDSAEKDTNGEYLIYKDGSEIQMDCGNFAARSSKRFIPKFYADGELVSDEFSEYTCKVTDENGNESEDIATFDYDTVTARKPGIAFLTFTSTDNSKVTMTVKVIVTQRANSISLPKDAMTLIAGDICALTAQVLPATTKNKNVIWESSNSAVVSVDEKGVVTAHEAGDAVITCKSSDVAKVYAQCSVIVQSNIGGISLDVTEKELLLGGKSSDASIRLTANIDAADPSIYTKTWSSSNENVAVVNENGLVEAYAPGEAIIKCAISEGTYAICKITVKQLIEDVNIYADKDTIVIGDTLKITSSIYPENASNRILKWESSNPNVAEVNEEGVVTAVGKGKTTIKCSATDENGKYSTWDIQVNKIVSDITLDTEKITLYVYEDKKIKTTVVPDDASNKELIWESSNDKVAAASDGVIYAYAPGTATITCMSSDGSNIRKTCEVTVLQQINTITFSESYAEINVGDVYSVKYTKDPVDVYNNKINWKSSNEKVAKVDENGVVTALSRGSVEITAVADDGKGAEATIYLTVNQLAKEIKLNKTSLSIAPGNTIDLIATVSPTDTNNSEVEWTSSNEKVATVSYGSVTAVGKGTAIISCKTTDGTELVATCKVTVIQPVTSIKLNATKKTLVKGKTVALKATVGPTSASNKSVTWKSSNKKVATVTASGVVKAVGKGKAVITCTAKDGSKVSAKCTITSVIRVTKVKLSKSSVAVKRGKKVTLKATVTPTTASNRAVVWKSSNSKIATVTQKGVVTAKKKGRVVITCKAKDGSGKYAKCTVVVK